LLISPDDLESLEETLAILSDPGTMAAIREGEEAVARGDFVSEANLRAALARRRTTG
jgi:PHD/YefM family antitoxin component YafN of YafNO toxin-antitoxin module